jgi:hypothetical protein
VHREGGNEQMSEQATPKPRLTARLQGIRSTGQDRFARFEVSWLNDRIGIDHGYHVPIQSEGVPQPSIPGRRSPRRLLRTALQDEGAALTCDVWRPVRGTVVNHQYRVAWSFDALDRFQSFGKNGCLVMGWDEHQEAKSRHRPGMGLSVEQRGHGQNRQVDRGQCAWQRK